LNDDIIKIIYTFAIMRIILDSEPKSSNDFRSFHSWCYRLSEAVLKRPG
jgi:hypothetical protein